MIRIFQTRVHNPPKSIGNCHAACIASLLEVDIDEVPQMESLSTEEYWPKLGHYLKTIGLHLLIIPAETKRFTTAIASDCNELFILSGKSPRNNNILHSVICRNMNIVHDPHPSQDGLDDIDSIEYLIPLNPSGFHVK